MKILTIVGARPQFIKAAAVSRQLAQSYNVLEVIVHTGQHFDQNMSDVFFEEMEIPHPDYHLEINCLSHGAMTGRMLEEIEKIILSEQPDYVMVYGDTNSTLAGALAASKLHIPLIHVEAGLRSFNRRMPEEINRILTDRVSDILYCPTETAVNNLEKEGFGSFSSEIVLCGDVMEDAALFYAQKAKEKSTILQNLKLEEEPFLLCTVHRQENTDDHSSLSEIVQAINQLAEEGWNVVLPLHPRTAGKIEKAGLSFHAEVLPPVGYFDMLQLLQHASMVLTDSGGLQKEAYFFNKFCITLREQTEWVELVENGYNQIVGANQAKIVQAVRDHVGRKFQKGGSLYGGGKAAKRIVQHLLSRS